MACPACSFIGVEGAAGRYVDAESATEAGREEAADAAEARAQVVEAAGLRRDPRENAQTAFGLLAPILGGLVPLLLR